MNVADIAFNKAFEALTDNTPLPWQVRLFTLLQSGKIPQICDIPTGLGKTSGIPIWLIALSYQAAEGYITLPRRLVYIINRRTVVDQATSVVERIRERLLCPAGRDWAEHESVLRSIASSLQILTPEPPLLAVSSLRGELADNAEWKLDPARAAIIVGTIDMIGSKLLFSGYGDGRYHRSHHAGLIGQDTLLIHDEAHLTPAFSDLLRHVAQEQRKCCEPRPIQVMDLSATQRYNDEDNDNTIRLDIKDEQNPIVEERIGAQKRIHLHQCNKKQQNRHIAEIASGYDECAARVLIYVRSPKDAQKVGDELRKKLELRPDKIRSRIALLTGMIRGHERDLLVTKNSVYRQFQHQGNPPAATDHPDREAASLQMSLPFFEESTAAAEKSLANTVYLISTSAGEVGIDIDADHIVCDITTLDSMIQRLGRVNRRGGTGREAHVDVVWTDDDENPDKNKAFTKAVAKTLKIVQHWGQESEDGTINASPRNLRRLIRRLNNEERAAAFSPIPTIPSLSDIELDAWSLTSINEMSGRPQVASYLHGLTNDPPTTYVVWRKEVAKFFKYEIDSRTLQEWFAVCPVQTNERLQMPTAELKVELKKLLKKHKKKNPNHDIQVVLLDEWGRAEWLSLSDVDRNSNLAYRTLVLPIEAGGIGEHGMFDPAVIDPVQDIADSDAEGRERERWFSEGGEERLLIDKELPLGGSWPERGRVTLDVQEDAEESRIELILRMPADELRTTAPEHARLKQTLMDHTNAIVDCMHDICERLHLGQHLEAALVAAAKWHDQGKDREIWQSYACNNNGSDHPLAKSQNYRHGRALSGYRHEFGSLLEAMHAPKLCDTPESELVLHLVAAHHGHARPHFDIRAFDKEKFGTSDNEKASVEVMQRFGRLQNCFGRWGLAWLESLLRCADIQASRPEE